MHPYLPYLSWIDSQEKTILKRLKTWVAINSFSHYIHGINHLLLHLQDAFKILEGTELSFRSSTPLLLIHKRPQASTQILLGGHFDTVYPPSSLFQRIEEQNGIWKGPGVADMKGGIAILLTALEAFERTPFSKNLGWKIILNSDEEIGSKGSAPAFEFLAPQCQAGLLFEPSFSDGSFVSQRKGSVTYTLKIKGRAAHVGRDFKEGRSAVFALAQYINWLEKRQNDTPDLVINVADLEGEGPVNIVPPFASCRINIRSNDLSLLQQVGLELEQLQMRDKKEGIEIDLIQECDRPPKLFDLKTQALFEAYGSCAKDLNQPFKLRETGGVCDGNILSATGLPTLDTAGAIGGALHTDQEYLVLSSLTERAKLAALFLFKLAESKIQLRRNGSCSNPVL